MSKQPRLTKSDWTEVFYALYSKEQGATVDGDKRWIKQLQSIRRKIGVDGETAAKLGVAAS